MRHFCWSLFCIGLLLLPERRMAADERVPRPPNIVVIVADDLSRRLSSFLPEGEGQSLMPTLDRMAREGVVLERMHSPSPICTPSRYALLTGRYPSRARSGRYHERMQREGQSVVEFNTHIVPGEETLATWLRDAGYVTGAVGKSHVIHVPGYVRLPFLTALDAPGVQETLQSNRALLQEAFKACGFDYAERLYFGNVDADGIEPLASHNQEWITEGALHFIEQHQDRPFFLYMATTIPHGPFEPERSWRGEKSVTPYGIEEEIPDVQAPRATIDERLKAAGINGWNAGAVLWLDDAVTAVMEKLDALNLADRTLIIFTSDHGTESKGGLYNLGTLTSALIWRRNGFPVGTRTEASLQLTDIAPTLLDIAGQNPRRPDVDGYSFLPVLMGTTNEVRQSLYFEMGYSRAIIKDGYKYIALRYPAFARTMAMDERQRLLDKMNRELRARGRSISTTDPNAPFSHLFLIPGGHDVDRRAIERHPGFFDQDQLYDLRSDPKEANNLSTLAGDSALAERLADLRAELDRYMQALPGTFGEFGEEP